MSVPTVCSVLLTLPVLLSSDGHATEKELLPRREYNHSLPHLSVRFHEEDAQLERVRIADQDSYDYSVITRKDDSFTKVTKRGRQKTVYRETFERAFIISDFEADVVGWICDRFVDNLKDFEENVQKERWDRCLYLDAFFPRFLKGFFYTYCAARNSLDAMPPQALIDDSLFESSLQSPLSDRRIRAWQEENEYTLKLRLSARELMYHLQEWQKKELKPKRRHPEIAFGDKVEKAFALFVTLYFRK